VSETPRAHLDRVVAAIARYLHEHPGAADSEAGIAQWWLPTLGVDASNEDVRQAVELLLRTGRIEQVDIAGGHPIWRAPDLAHPRSDAQSSQD
jgi:hypothetical protein